MNVKEFDSRNENIPPHGKILLHTITVSIIMTGATMLTVTVTTTIRRNTSVSTSYFSPLMAQKIHKYVVGVVVVV